MIQDMYDSNEAVVRSAAGVSEAFPVGAGLKQGSALSPFLFALVLDSASQGKSVGTNIR